MMVQLGMIAMYSQCIHSHLLEPYLPTCLPLTGTLRLAPTGGCAESNGVLGRDHGLDVVGDAARQTEGTESRNMGSSNVRSIAEVLNMIGILQQS